MRWGLAQLDAENNGQILPERVRIAAQERCAWQAKRDPLLSVALAR